MNPTYVLLGLLLNGERHGYELKRTIDQEFAPFWKIDWAQLYRSLAKMKQHGWIKQRAEPGSRGPARKVYALTSPGKRVCQNWLDEPAADQKEFLIKLHLAQSAGWPTVHLVHVQQCALNRERATRKNNLRMAQIQGDAGRIILADAALREIEGYLSTIQVWSKITEV